MTNNDTKHSDWNIMKTVTSPASWSWEGDSSTKYNGSKIPARAQAPLFFPTSFYFMISNSEVDFLLQKWPLHCQTFHLSSRQRERGIRGEGQSGIMLLMPVKSAKRPTQQLLLIFHWLELNQMSPPPAKKSGRCSFCGYIDILPPTPPNQSFFRKEKGKNEFGVVSCPSGIVFPPQINTCLLR